MEMADEDDQTAFDAPFIAILLLDVDTAISRRAVADTATHRREIVRTAFAAIEGVIWVYRTHVLSVVRELGMLEPGEEIVLSELSYAVTDKGKVTPQSRHLSTSATFRLLSRIASRLSEASESPFGGSGWVGFQKALKIRHRVTHPKSANDLLIADEDIATSLAAFYWILEITLKEMQAANAAYRAWVEDMRGILEALKRGDADTLKAYRQVEAEFS